MSPVENIYTKKSSLFSIAAVLFLIVCIAYSNHFTNGFEFDDSHSIVNNGFIRSIKNIPLFFTDVKYSGTNPGNQGYRPVYVTLNAIDYWMAGGLNQVYFHVDIFCTYLVLLVLLYFFYRKVYAISGSGDGNYLVALLAVGFYGVHAANAETINYICMRSDSFSTLWVVASLLLYMSKRARKYYLYLFAMAIAIGTKETGIMCAPLLFFYILFFEEDCSLRELLLFRNPSKILQTFKRSIPALLMSFVLFFLFRRIVSSVDSTQSNSMMTSESWRFFYTQWVIIAHYIGNFVLPLDLSADPDFVLLDSILGRKVLLSLALILSLFVIAFRASSHKESRPIAFGILWFFIALAPTSVLSFGTIGQLANDHRTFFPYIGLVLSLGCWLRLLFLRHEEYIMRSKYLVSVFAAGYVILISLHAYGTFQRNKVWSSGATLWYDVTQKSPNNGRGQMNYGLSLMSVGKYDETLPYFKRTLELMPDWAYIQINMGVLRNAMGFPEEAEQYFRKAVNYHQNVPDAYYFYARWLDGKGRMDEAIDMLKKGKAVSPGHAGIIEYLDILLARQAESNETLEERIKRMEKVAQSNPTGANYIELSMVYYKNNMFNECIVACEKAAKLDPKSATAYNNMGCAYNQLGKWEKGAEACSKALEIDPGFQLARNNLNWAKKSLSK